MKNTLLAIGALLLIVGIIVAGYIKNPRSQELKVIDNIPTPVTDVEYTLADIGKHSTESDCWMAIDDYVYDVTKYIPDHPDGRSILNGCGLDATDMFRQIKKHIPKAQNDLPPYQIGLLVK